MGLAGSFISWGVKNHFSIGPYEFLKCYVHFMALPYCACYFIITRQCHEIYHEFIRYWKWICSLLVVGWFFALPNCALL